MGTVDMSMTRKILRRMCILAGMAVLSVAAHAFTFDVKIAIDRALNSPTLTVRYSGANVALVELKVNGESVGTRSVADTKANGETNFTIDLSSLHDGDNSVEISLFDKQIDIATAGRAEDGWNTQQAPPYTGRLEGAMAIAMDRD